jgi:hypothetical protein
LVPICLRLPGYEADLFLVLDTGAERTLLEGTHLRAAGVDIFQGPSLALQSFSGSKTTAYVHRATIVVGELEIESEVAFSTQPLLRQILGRDLLNYLIVGLRERVGEFYLGPDPLSPLV